MDHLAAARFLVEIVDILSYHDNIIVLLQGGDVKVSPVRLHALQLGAPQVIELKYQGRVFLPSRDRCHIHYVMLLPEASAVPEGGDPAFGTDAGARENYYLFHQNGISSLGSGAGSS